MKRLLWLWLLLGGSAQAQSLTLADTISIKRSWFIFNTYSYYYQGKEISLGRYDSPLWQLNDVTTTDLLTRSYRNRSTGLLLFGASVGSAVAVVAGGVSSRPAGGITYFVFALGSIYPNLRSRRQEKLAALRYNAVLRQRATSAGQ